MPDRRVRCKPPKISRTLDDTGNIILHSIIPVYISRSIDLVAVLKILLL